MNNSAHQRPDPDVSAGESALDWARSHGSGDRIAEHSRTQRRGQVIRRTATGVVALAILAGAGIFWQIRPIASAAAPVPPSSVIVAAPAHQILSDGSVVELKDGARIDVAYTSTLRRVQLLSGEAHFAVAKNQDVPFIVMAEGIEVRAVGTAFAVHLASKQIEIIVTEGTVAVDQAAAGLSAKNPTAAVTPSTLVSAGNRVVMDIAPGATPPPVVAMSETEQSDRLSWRVPRIELSGTPLAEALPVFNRYSPVRLSLADPSLGTLEVSGVLRPDNPNALLHVLKVEYGLEADRKIEGEIVLRRP